MVGDSVSQAYMRAVLGVEREIYGFSRQEVGGVPEDVRRYFSLLSRVQQVDQRIEAELKSKEPMLVEMEKIRHTVTSTGAPIVARMPNGETYIMYRDEVNEPTVEKVQVVNL
jgi:hypothetical protein